MLEQKSLNQGYSPLDTINQALHFWWFLFALAVTGGLVGFLFHQARPPVYESVGRLTGGIDYVSTGPLTQYDEDVALNTVGNILYSGVVFDRVVEKARLEGISLDRAGFMKMATMERKFTTWDLRVRSTDAHLAFRLANLWVEEGQVVIEEGYRHAVQADQLNRYIKTLENCLGRSVSSEPSGGLCVHTRFEEIQADLDAFMEQYNIERTNQGRYCQGRTPLQTFMEGLNLYQRHVYEGLETEGAA